MSRARASCAAGGATRSAGGSSRCAASSAWWTLSAAAIAGRHVTRLARTVTLRTADGLSPLVGPLQQHLLLEGLDVDRRGRGADRRLAAEDLAGPQPLGGAARVLDHPARGAVG